MVIKPQSVVIQTIIPVKFKSNYIVVAIDWIFFISLSAR